MWQGFNVRLPLKFSVIMKFHGPKKGEYRQASTHYRTEWVEELLPLVLIGGAS